MTVAERAEIMKLEQVIKSTLDRQRAFFKAGGTRSLAWRKQVLWGMERYLIDKQESLLQALKEDLGKPGLEAYLAEYHFILQEIRLVRKSLERWLAPRRIKSPLYFQPCSSRVEYEPYGVCLIMAPWNYPLQLALSPLIAAVAAGNTVVLKPSEISRASERFLVRMLADCFAGEHVSTITGGREVAGALLEQRFDFLFFTGSTRIGRVVAEKAGKHLTPCILELGGKCPAVVADSADIEVAARRILAGKMFNAGQTCFAPDFVVVQRDVKERLLQAMQRVIETTPWQDEMGTIVNRSHYQRLEGLWASHEGAVLTGFDDSGEDLRMAPRVLSDVSWGDEIMEDEIFGPLLPVLTYDRNEELVQALACRESPLALYLFAKDKTWIRTMMDSLPSGGVCVNDTMKQGSSLHLPFGGVGESGYGRYRGQTGVLALSYQRAVVTRPSGGPLWAELLPPYGERFAWLRKWLR